MYSRSYRDPHRTYRSTASSEGGDINFSQKEEANFLPPNYSGVAYDRAPEENADEPERSSKYPQIFNGEQRREYDEEYGRREEHGGLFSSLSEKSISAEDMLIAAMIVLLMNNRADDDILVILGFLLIVGM